MSGIVSRQSAPPGPPGSFESGPAKHDPGLSEAHLRLKPEERFRSFTRPGAPPSFSTPPLAPLSVNERAPEQIMNNARYPAMRYHAIHGQKIVNDPDHEMSATNPADGWVTTPADLPPDPNRELTTPQKLALLADMVQALADEAFSEETPLECLERVLLERRNFALRVANHPQESPDALDEAAQAVATKPKKGK